MEKNSLVKFGHVLSVKALFPSSIQRQNVKLALNIFNEQNIGALKCAAKSNPESLVGVEGTCKFIEYIVNWWKIVNCHAPFKGKRFNDPYQEPIRKDNEFHLNFLKKLSVWLKSWRLTVPISDALTGQTFQAFITSVDSLVLLIPYLFQNYSVDYILLGKFQTDDLESRFGCYRQLSGSNYYISLMQVMESERKLRFKSVVLFSSKNHILNLKSLLPTNEKKAENADVEPFISALDVPCIMENHSQDTLQIFAYIGGYIAMKQLHKQSCEVCCQWLQIPKTAGLDINEDIDGSVYGFIKELDRGQLTLPSQVVIETVAKVHHVLNSILTNHEISFINCKNQLDILYTLSCKELLKDTIENKECLCNKKYVNTLHCICSTASKIFLNNLVKRKNSFNDERKKNQSKMAKLKK